MIIGRTLNNEIVSLDDWDIDAIREAIGQLQKTMHWYEKRHISMPYDWNDYGHKDIMLLLKLCKIDYDGRLKKKDKKGAWR